jgi:site-specific recombinase XerD
MHSAIWQHTGMDSDLLDLPGLLVSWQRVMRSEHKSAATVKTYSAGVAAFLRWCDSTGTNPVLDKATVQAFIAALLGAGAEGATAHARFKALRRFAAWLVAEGELDLDPLLGAKPPQVGRKVTPALTDDQLRRLIKACQGKTLKDRRDEAIVRLMAETGLRAGEVTALKVADVNLDDGLVTVRRGKGDKGRVAPFGPQTTAAIDRYVRARRHHRLADTGALWVGVAGKTFGYSGLDGALKARAQAAGINGFHLHLLRHTAATRWLRHGGSEGGLMAVAGWSSRSMLDRYTAASASERAADEARGLGLGEL